jgi:hypothetical protein
VIRKTEQDGIELSANCPQIRHFTSFVHLRLHLTGKVTNYLVASLSLQMAQNQNLSFSDASLFLLRYIQPFLAKTKGPTFLSHYKQGFMFRKKTLVQCCLP